MKNGKVWLVGAGPGDLGLMTVKGMEVLAAADVVVYDSLVGDSILGKIPDTARLINVGKRASHHTMPQDQINEVLLEQAQKGYKVVRLKGGDPFLFGRGGEELELLLQNGIDCEVVPGVTSALSVPAYNGIPVTHRDYCSSIHIITGHRRAGKEYDIDFKALTDTKGTLIFLMGVTALLDICKGLLDAGMDPDMPAALLSKGTTAGQRKIVATVSTLADTVEKEGAVTPAIIVVGKVCTLADELYWRSCLPLAGWKVLVTRPKAHASTTSQKLRELGAEVLELPSIATLPMPDGKKQKEAYKNLADYQWIVFTSPTGVEVFFDKLIREKQDIRSLGNAKIAAIGEGTARKLRERGLIADLMPETYDGDSLGEALAKVLASGEKVLIPRAEKGNENLVRLLKEAGAEVTDLPTYCTRYEKSTLIDERREFEAGEIQCAVFTSASTVKGFAEGVKGLDFTKVKAACIGRQTKAAAEALGMKTYMAEKATIDSLVELVVRMKNEENS
ncbi:MAG: uroporphyrinogen-III C-methyltransferase [Blautia sp.]|nr:uroporphyrinogen-III C-methyltransferase [Blautia sp.]